MCDCEIAGSQLLDHGQIGSYSGPEVLVQVGFEEISSKPVSGYLPISRDPGVIESDLESNLWRATVTERCVL